MTTAAARGVTVEGLEHAYDQEPVLHGVSFGAEPGESIALLCLLYTSDAADE